jgi:hypothetical protein
MSSELLAIAIPVAAVILMVIFGRAVQHFLIDTPSRPGPTESARKRD